MMRIRSADYIRSQDLRDIPGGPASRVSGVSSQSRGIRMRIASVSGVSGEGSLKQDPVPVARRPRRRRSSQLAGGVSILLGFILLAILAPWIAPSDPVSTHLESALRPPSPAHPFGTDQFGRDILSRAIYATRVDMQIAIIAVLIPGVIGTALGALAGYYRGWIDACVMRLSDVVLAFPYLVLIIAIMAMLGPGLINMYVAVALGGWTFYARLVRGEFLTATESEYAEAARALGASDGRLICRHLIPNTLSPVVTFACADAVLDIALATALGFLGLGVRPPTPEWGAMIADGRAYMLTAWWISVFPGVMAVGAGIGFSMVGDALLDQSRRTA
jgi:peptide/nickel transport system permease protein